MQISDFDRVAGAFAAAARREIRAGFVGVEVHGEHGYLPAQLLSSLEN